MKGNWLRYNKRDGTDPNTSAKTGLSFCSIAILAIHLFSIPCLLDRLRCWRTSNNAVTWGYGSGGLSTIAWWDLFAELTRTARRFLGSAKTIHAHNEIVQRPEASPISYSPLRRLILTDEVSRVLFAEYAGHRQGHRGDEETGWVLLGVRRADEALALATLPAGAERDAGDSHVKFNSMAQAFAAQVVRQENKYLTMLGVVHTHPGSLRHPSDGDYRGDIQWVPSRRGGEGIFGIGTADVKPRPGSVAWQPTPHVQCLGEFCFSWYSLRAGDRNYRPLTVELTLGPDLALPLRPIWEELEVHADRLDRLAQQLRGVAFEVMPGREKPALVLTVPLMESGKAIRVFMEGKEVQYLVIDPMGGMIADVGEDRVDRGVFLLLSELASTIS